MSGSLSERNATTLNSLGNFFSSKGTYTPPVVPGAAPTGNVDSEGTYTPPVVPGAAPETNAIPNRRGGSVNGNMEGSTNTPYQELPNGPPPIPANYKELANGPSAPSNEITNLNNSTKKQIAGSFRYGTPTASDSVGIQWVILVVLSAIPIAIYAFAPSYGNTILTAFYTTIAIFGGILCLIAAVSIMMNIYKTDGTPIMIMMGFLGAFASPFIVFGYWIYHLWAWTQSVKPRPYFGLFPIGFHGSPGSFWDSFLAPFHDSSNDKTYEFLVADAKSILYGNPRD
jgi:hypothetical protein